MTRAITAPVLKRDLSAAYVRSRLEYDPESGVFTWRLRRVRRQYDASWNTRFAEKVAGSLDKDGYVTISLRGKHYRAHQLAWLYVTGVWPPHELDHRDRDKSNNRFLNLRPATKSQNAVNTAAPRSNRSGRKGVIWQAHARKWRARIKINGRTIHLGYFAQIEEAAHAYREAANRHFGAFAAVA
ncbi:HNH endonuclease signature motif containing protein [Methylobacterium sp. D48H]